MSPQTQAPTKPVVLITRAEADAEPLAVALTALGAQVVRQPAVRMEAHLDAAAQAQALQLWPSLAAIACASRYGVRHLKDFIGRHNLVLGAQVALFAVGPATAAEALNHLGRAATVALPHTAVGLAAMLTLRLPPPAAVLLPTALGAGWPLAQALTAAGLTPLRLPLYATHTVVAQAPMTGGPIVDYIVFTSPSCVRGYLASGHAPGRARVVTLGPSTSAAAQAAGLNVFAQARPASLAGLIDVLKACLCETLPQPTP